MNSKIEKRKHIRLNPYPIFELTTKLCDDDRVTVLK